MKNIIYLFILFYFLFTSNLHALCKGSFFNLITETGWTNLFPLKIGGITIIDSDQPDVSDKVSSPICICIDGINVKVGIPVSFWEPYRIVDAVIDPGCFPSFGIDISGMFDSGHLVGGVEDNDSKSYNPQYFAQGHFIISPILAILGLFTDVPCIDHVHEDLDIFYMTELDPLWNDDISALILSPEALVFSNPIVGMACMADAMSAAFGYPRDELFWCMGTWYDSTYPFVGSTEHGTIVEGAASVSGRLLYKLHRQMLLGDRAIDYCSEVLTPIWIKSHWRFQPLRPKAMTSGSARIGELPETWAYKTQLLDPSMKGTENWSFLLWRKINCCLSVNLLPTP